MGGGGLARRPFFTSPWRGEVDCARESERGRERVNFVSRPRIPPRSAFQGRVKRANASAPNATRRLALRAGWGCRHSDMTCGQAPSFSARESARVGPALPPLRTKRGDGAPGGATFFMYAPCRQGAAPPGAPSRRLCGAGPRFRRSLKGSHRQPAPGGGSYCPRAEPRRRPSVCFARAHPRAPICSTRAGATGSRPSWERTGRIIVVFGGVGISSHKNVIVVLLNIGRKHILGRHGRVALRLILRSIASAMRLEGWGGQPISGLREIGEKMLRDALACSHTGSS